MHRIDDYGAAAGGMWTEGDPGQAIPATKITDDWLNDVQEEIASLIEAAGITLVKGNRAQLRAAIDTFIAAAASSEASARASADSTHAALTNPHSATAAATASRLVLRDASGRAAFADPSAAGDAATKGYVDGRQATRANLPTVGQIVSATATNWGVTSTTYVDCIEVTITTTGRPVMLMLTGDVSNPGVDLSASGGKAAWFAFKQGSTVIREMKLKDSGTAGVLTVPGSLVHLDAPAAGTWTYRLALKTEAGGQASIPSTTRLVAYEL